jgi:hypothetical protein
MVELVLVGVAMQVMITMDPEEAEFMVYPVRQLVQVVELVQTPQLAMHGRH